MIEMEFIVFDYNLQEKKYNVGVGIYGSHFDTQVNIDEYREYKKMFRSFNVRE